MMGLVVMSPLINIPSPEGQTGAPATSRGCPHSRGFYSSLGIPVRTLAEPPHAPAEAQWSPFTVLVNHFIATQPVCPKPTPDRGQSSSSSSAGHKCHQASPEGGGPAASFSHWNVTSLSN